MTNELRGKLDSVFISITHAGFWAGNTIFGTFVVTYLYSAGYSASQVGLVMAFMSVFNIVAQPIWGFIADTKIGVKKAILICMVVAIPIVLLVPVFAQGMIVMMLGAFFISIFEYPTRSLLDSITNLGEARNKYIVYGVSRGIGSFASAIASLFAGRVLDAFGLEWAFGIHGMLFLLAILALTAYKGIECDPAPKTEEKGKHIKNASNLSIVDAAKILFRNHKFVAIFISSALLNIGLKAGLTFTPIMISELGGTSAHNGYSMAVNTVGMLPCMLIYSYLFKKRILSNKVLYILGCVFTVARIMSLALVHSLWPLIIVQIVNSLSYGFLQPSMVQTISDVSPVELRATAITIVTGGFTAISSILGDYVAGIIVDGFGMTSMFVICTVIAIVGVAAYTPILKDQ